MQAKRTLLETEDSYHYMNVFILKLLIPTRLE